jgi:hypothetical protein
MENTIITKKPTKISFKQLFEFASHLPRIPESGRQPVLQAKFREAT